MATPAHPITGPSSNPTPIESFAGVNALAELVVESELETLGVKEVSLSIPTGD